MYDSAILSRCFNLAAILFIAVVAIYLPNGATAGPENLSDCATVDGKPLRLAEPRRLQSDVEIDFQTAMPLKFMSSIRLGRKL